MFASGILLHSLPCYDHCQSLTNMSSQARLAHGKVAISSCSDCLKGDTSGGTGNVVGWCDWSRMCPLLREKLRLNCFSDWIGQGSRAQVVGSRAVGGIALLLVVAAPRTAQLILHDPERKLTTQSHHKAQCLLQAPRIWTRHIKTPRHGSRRF